LYLNRLARGYATRSNWSSFFLGNKAFEHTQLFIPLLVPDEIVNLHVMLPGVIPRTITTHPIFYELSEVMQIRIPHPNGALQGGFKTCVVKVLEGIPIPLTIWFVRVVGVHHRIGQSPGGPHTGTVP
jgi:hypothetical protein